jgi:lysophospholipase L1-like esterase
VAGACSGDPLPGFKFRVRCTDRLIPSSSFFDAPGDNEACWPVDLKVLDCREAYQLSHWLPYNYLRAISPFVPGWGWRVVTDDGRIYDGCEEPTGSFACRVEFTNSGPDNTGPGSYYELADRISPNAEAMLVLLNWNSYPEDTKQACAEAVAGIWARSFGTDVVRLYCGGRRYASRSTYVAYGDSYSSGQGSESYAHEGCARSVFAYPVAFRRLRPTLRLNFRACTGAKIPDVVQKQLRNPHTPDRTRLVTISVGGNDAGFAGVVTRCITLPKSYCFKAIAEAKRFIRDELPRKLANVYDRIRWTHPNAQVFVLGYPRLFGPEFCGDTTGISIPEQERMNGASDLINDVTAWVAAVHHVNFIDPRAKFKGHAICAPHSWIRGISNPPVESFHPTSWGQKAYAGLLRRKCFCG